MDPTPWIRFRARHGVTILGHFKNDCGERFIIYRMVNGNVLYITGDEFEWDVRHRLIGTDFVYSDDEREKIAMIVWPTFTEMLGVVQARGDSEPPDHLWRAWDGTPEPEITGA